MLISNNATAGFILGTLNNNLHKKNKAAGQLSLGEKIRNAGDDASGYAISERMRVRIRSLDQADANVQNGASMLRVAEGAIQSQIELLRTVKEKVIDAHNDTNTDADRVTIQKEITEYYNEINDIAAETTFNGRHLLLGTKVTESIKSWYRLDHAEELEGSDDFGFVYGSEAVLDGYNVDELSTSKLSGGTRGSSNVLNMTFPLSVNPADLNGKAFKVMYDGGEQIFVFDEGHNRQYGKNVHTLDVSGDSLTIAIRDKVQPVLSSYIKAEYVSNSAGRGISFTTKKDGYITNNPPGLYNVVGVTLREAGYYPADPLPSSYITNTNSGVDGATASWTWDLSSYNSTDMSKAEDFISIYKSQAINFSGTSITCEFIDGKNTLSTDSMQKIPGSTLVDLNQIRSAVSSGKTVAEAFADLLAPKLGSSYVESVKTSGQVTGIRIKATEPGEDGNKQTVTFYKAQLREYTLDFKSLFSSKGIDDQSIAAQLDGKGFRFYDGTDANKWINVLFVNGTNPNDDERPASGGYGMDIDTLVIDLSDVKDFQSFMDTLYKGDGDKNSIGLSQLLDNTTEHFHLGIDYVKGTMTIYDDQRRYVTDEAKIVDGVLDNVVSDARNTYVNELVIQHTDKASANICVRIPQTTMDQIFGYKIGDGSLDDYSVLTSDKREYLLGRDYPTKVEGILDKGLQYLIDANTLIGSQIVHMEYADANIVTETENTMAAESVIRDADIAKSAMDYATANILSQSTMAMLSQYNHNSSDVLNLLQ